MRATIPAPEIWHVIRRYKLTTRMMEVVAFFMVQQVRDRFRTSGQSGGTSWVQKKAKGWGHDDGRKPLTGPTSNLLDSYQGYGTADRAVAYSDDPKSLVNQLGTVGAGGTLPTIRPKRAKALFIPITDRARDSER